MFLCINARRACLLLSASVFLAFAGCDGRLFEEPESRLSEVIDANSTASGALTEQQARAIVASPEAAAVFAVFDEWTYAIQASVDSGMSFQEFKRLVSGEDIDLMVGVFGGHELLDSYMSRKNKAINDLSQSFPDLAGYGPGYEIANGRCEVSDEDRLSNMYWSMYNRSGVRVPPMSEIGVNDDPEGRHPNPVCGSYWQQVKLLACAGASGAWCGPGAPLCAWGCWCMLCPNSPLGDIIC